MQLDELFQQPQALPAVPKIVHELIDSFNNEDISIEEIARKLEISIETVKVHKKHMYSKLGIKSQSELFSIFLQAQSA